MATEDGVKHDSLTSANFSIEEESSSSFLAKIQQYIQSFSSAVSLTPPSNDDGAKTAGPDWTAACELLIMYLNNIIKNPSVPRYRRISTTNSSYMKSLLPVEKHATRLLAAVGFVKKDDSTYFEYAWHSLPSSVEVTATASSNSSSSSSSKAGADNSSSSRIPVSVEVAVRLLQRAVALLTALKATAKGGGGEGKEGALLALAELIVQQMTTASTAAATADAASGPGASLEGSGFASQQAKDGSSSGDDGLIAVVDLADEEEEEGEGAVQLGGGSAQDDSVDFMKV